MGYKICFGSDVVSDSEMDYTIFSNPRLRIIEGEAGEFEFTMHPRHPAYNLPQIHKTEVRVYLKSENEVPTWCGFVEDIQYDFLMNKKVTVVGDLALLSQTVCRQKSHMNGITTNELMAEYVANHNEQIHEDNKKFVSGGSDENVALYCYVNYNTTAQELKTDILEDLGGILRVEYSMNGNKLVKTLKHYIRMQGGKEQEIWFGENLLDLAIGIEAGDICTAIIPLGAMLAEDKRTADAVEGLEEYLTIKSQNNGVDYLYSEQAVNTYGWHWKTVKWDKVTKATTLKKRGQNYLTSYQFSNMVITARAMDMGITQEEMDLLDDKYPVKVHSPYHGLDANFRITEREYFLEEPEKNTVTCGHSAIPKITDIVNGRTSTNYIRTTTSGEQFYPTPVPGDQEETAKNRLTLTDGILTITELKNKPTLTDGILTIN